jgi:predicted NBD/HSP70 family sugar kinase
MRRGFMQDDRKIPSTFRTSGTNLTRAKTHNFSVVMEVVRTRGPISRTEIAAITSLSRQTVQNLVAELEAANLVTMTPGEIKGRGHPGMTVMLNADSAYTFGVHVDRRSLTALACNLDGKIIWSATEALTNPSAHVASAAIVQAIQRFRLAHPGPGGRLLGLGIAAPGPFGPNGTNVRDAGSFPEIGASETLTLLEQETGLPISLENDATAAAVGEWLYGAGKGRNNLAVLHFGTGLGAGFILGGSPYRGSSSNAGEIGHMIVVPGGRACFCGNNGCLERYLSFGALCDVLGVEPNNAGAGQDVLAMHNRGNATLAAWLNDAAPMFRQAISIIEAMVDPETIIIGGTVPEGLLDLIIAAAAPLSRSLTSRDRDGVRVMRGTSGPLTVALGAAAVSISSHFAPSVSRLVL